MTRRSTRTLEAAVDDEEAPGTCDGKPATSLAPSRTALSPRVDAHTKSKFPIVMHTKRPCRIMRPQALVSCLCYQHSLL